MAGYDPVMSAQYICATNADGFTLGGASIAPRQALCLGIAASDYQEIGGTLLRTVTFAIGIKPETYDLELADRGLHVLDAGKLIEIRKGAPPIRVEQPWPLDGGGRAKVSATDTPEKLTFRPYRALPFAALGFN